MTIIDFVLRKYAVMLNYCFANLINFNHIIFELLMVMSKLLINGYKL